MSYMPPGRAEITPGARKISMPRPSKTFTRIIKNNRISGYVGRLRDFVTVYCDIWRWVYFLSTDRKSPIKLFLCWFLAESYFADRWEIWFERFWNFEILKIHKKYQKLWRKIFSRKSENFEIENPDFLDGKFSKEK